MKSTIVSYFILLLAAITVRVADEASTKVFHVTKLTAATSDEESEGYHRTITDYNVEGYAGRITYRGACKDMKFYNLKKQEITMHLICVVPQAGEEYSVKFGLTWFMFPCGTPDAECKDGDGYKYSAYTIVSSEEGKEK